MNRDHDVHIQRTWTVENSEFHSRLVDLADCSWLVATMSDVLAPFPRELTWLAAGPDFEILRDYVDDHESLIGALEAGD